MQARHVWTDAEDATIRVMAEQGAYAIEIAERIGVSRVMVFDRARKIGVSMSGPALRARLAATRGAVGRRTIAKARRVLLSGDPDIEQRRRKAIYESRCRKLYPKLPPHLWPEVNATRLRHHLLSSEAYEVVLADWRRSILAAMRAICNAAAEHAKAEIAKHNSFEAKLARVAAGTARVVPTLRLSRPVGNERSLIGIATGML